MQSSGQTGISAVRFILHKKNVQLLTTLPKTRFPSQSQDPTCFIMKFDQPNSIYNVTVVKVPINLLVDGP